VLCDLASPTCRNQPLSAIHISQPQHSPPPALGSRPSSIQPHSDSPWQVRAAAEGGRGCDQVWAAGLTS
jgi:hypothetical protein